MSRRFCKKIIFFLSSSFIALFPIQVGKSFCYFNFKMAFRFLHLKIGKWHFEFKSGGGRTNLTYDISTLTVTKLFQV